MLVFYACQVFSVRACREIGHKKPPYAGGLCQAFLG
jgi:hypothetical protein